MERPNPGTAPNPGSDEALAQGCTCAGVEHVSADCPLHGTTAQLVAKLGPIITTGPPIAEPPDE